MKVVFKVDDKRSVLTSEAKDRAVKSDLFVNTVKHSDKNNESALLDMQMIDRKKLRNIEPSNISEYTLIDDNNKNALHDKRKTSLDNLTKAFSNANYMKSCKFFVSLVCLCATIF